MLRELKGYTKLVGIRCCLLNCLSYKTLNNHKLFFRMTHLSLLLNSETVLYIPSPIHRWFTDSSKIQFLQRIYVNITSAHTNKQKKLHKTVQTDVPFVHFIAPFTADGRPHISSSYTTYTTDSKLSACTT
jgi:hypothetical protein